MAVVTGGGSGIGRAVALLYAEEGAKVVVSDINESAAQETVELIKKASRGADTQDNHAQIPFSRFTPVFLLRH